MRGVGEAIAAADQRVLFSVGEEEDKGGVGGLFSFFLSLELDAEKMRGARLRFVLVEEEVQLSFRLRVPGEEEGREKHSLRGR